MAVAVQARDTAVRLGELAGGAVILGSATPAVESLGRTIGPVWGNASLEQFGEAAPYVSAATLLLLTLVLAAGFQVTRRAERSETAIP